MTPAIGSSRMARPAAPSSPRSTNRPSCSRRASPPPLKPSPTPRIRTCAHHRRRAAVVCMRLVTASSCCVLSFAASCPAHRSTSSPACGSSAASGAGSSSRCPRAPGCANEWGTVYGGVLTLLAKSAAAAAVQSTAVDGTGFTALDVKVNFLRAVPADGRELVATGTVLHRGKRLAVATAEVMHGDDRVAVLTGTTALTPPASLGSMQRRNTRVCNAWPAAASSSSARPTDGADRDRRSRKIRAEARQ